MSDTAEPVETIESLKAQLENSRSSQRGVDRAYKAEKERADALQARLVKETDVDTIAARLDNVEKAFKEKERKLELEYHLRKQALAAGIDYTLLDGIPFDSEQAIDARIMALSNFAINAGIQAIGAKLTTASKPQAGNDIVNLSSRLPDLSNYPELIREMVSVK
jgi:hypothetical protein